jgi:hypothetical protein
MAAPPVRARIADGQGMVTPEWIAWFSELDSGSVQVIRAGTAVTVASGSTTTSSPSSMDAALLTGGPIPPSVMPALGGDVTMEAGTVTTTLANIPIAVQESITRLGTLTSPLRLAADVDAHLIPALTDTYDLGSVTRWWRQGYLSQLNAVLFALETQTLFGGYATIGSDAGTFAADVASADTTIDFGKAMTPNDFVLVRSLDTSGAAVTEYFQVLTLVAGTRYNVTRNLSGAGAKNWAAGVAFLVLGTSGDGRIDLFAYDGKPRIMFVQQGATYNAQNLRGQIGNLNGSYGYATDIFGAAFGDYSKAWIAVDPTNGLRMGYDTDVVVQIDGSGNASFESGIDIGAAGSITAGGVVLDASGLYIDPVAAGGGGAFANANAVRWSTDATYRNAIWRSDDSSASLINTWHLDHIQDDSVIKAKTEIRTRCEGPLGGFYGDAWLKFWTDGPSSNAQAQFACVNHAYATDNSGAFINLFSDNAPSASVTIGVGQPTEGSSGFSAEVGTFVGLQISTSYTAVLGELRGDSAFYERGRSVAMGMGQDYTPTFSNSAGGAALGNGTISGRYSVIGKTVIGYATFTVGSTTNLGGAGALQWSLPTTARVGAAMVTNGRAFDTSAATWHFGSAFLPSTTNIQILAAGAGGGSFSPTVPFTFATGDIVQVQFVYEEA